MSGSTSRCNVWMVETMRHYLSNNLQATDKDIDYLKCLYALKSKTRELPSKPKGFRFPSTIIDGYLYHGDLGHALNKELLEELNIRHIVNVCETQLKKEIIEHFNVLWININDGLATDIRQYFDTTNNFLQMCQAKSEKVLVHCQMGISRSSSIILAYLIKYHNSNLYEAYDHLVACRRTASPNFGFFLQLIRYEKELHSIEAAKKDSLSNELLDNAVIQTTIISSGTCKDKETILDS